MRSLVLVFVLAFMLSSHVHAAPNSTQLLHAAEEQLPTCAVSYHTCGTVVRGL